MKHPERVSAIITQNGNAYIEGLSKEWGPWQAYWKDPSPENRRHTRGSSDLRRSSLRWARAIRDALA